MQPGWNVAPTKMRELLEWRNRQTRRTQNSVPSRACEFNSHLQHPNRDGEIMYFKILIGDVSMIVKAPSEEGARKKMKQFFEKTGSDKPREMYCYGLFCEPISKTNAELALERQAQVRDTLAQLGITPLL